VAIQRHESESGPDGLTTASFRFFICNGFVTRFLIHFHLGQISDACDCVDMLEDGPLWQRVIRNINIAAQPD
jgi:hypothetical protein